MIVFGLYNERMYLDQKAHGIYSGVFSSAVIRRHTGTPFMGYSGASYLVQEVCNSLFDALFHILPLQSDMDAQASAAPTRQANSIMWEPEAHQKLDEFVLEEPVLTRISAPKPCATIRNAPPMKQAKRPSPLNAFWRLQNSGEQRHEEFSGGEII